MGFSPTPPGLLPEDVLPQPLAEKGLYKPGGYQCWDCEFTSKKKGFSGRQALRAHLKRHKNERRAWQRPLLIQVPLVLILLGAAIVGWLGVKLPFPLPFDTPVLTVPADITRWAVLGCTTALIVASTAVLFSPAEYGGKALATVSRLLVLVGSLAGLWGVTVTWELVTPVLSWPYQVPLWGLLLLTPVLGGPRRARFRSGKATYTCSNCGGQFKAGTAPGMGRCTGCEAEVRVGLPEPGRSSPYPESQYPLYDRRGRRP